jgi:hypothetical protein
MQGVASTGDHEGMFTVRGGLIIDSSGDNIHLLLVLVPSTTAAEVMPGTLTMHTAPVLVIVRHTNLVHGHFLHLVGLILFLALTSTSLASVFAITLITVRVTMMTTLLILAVVMLVFMLLAVLLMTGLWTVLRLLADVHAEDEYPDEVAIAGGFLSVISNLMIAFSM